jgi:hypothetical protein
MRKFICPKKDLLKFVSRKFSAVLGNHSTILANELNYLDIKYKEFIDKFNTRKNNLEEENYFLSSYNKILKEFPINDKSEFLTTNENSNPKIIDFMGTKIDTGKMNKGLNDFINKSEKEQTKENFLKMLKEMLNHINTYEQAHIIINRYFKLLEKEDITLDLYFKEEAFITRLLILYQSKSEVVKKLLEISLSLILNKFGEASTEAAQVYHLISLHALNNSLISTSTTNAEKSLNIAKSLSNNETSTASSNATLGLIKVKGGSVNDAISLLKEASEVFKAQSLASSEKPLLHSLCCYNLASLYSVIDDRNTLKYLEESLIQGNCYASHRHNTDVLTRLGEIYKDNGYLNKSLNAFIEVIQLEIKLKSKSNNYQTAVQGVINLLENFDLKLESLEDVNKQVTVLFAIYDHTIDANIFNNDKYSKTFNDILKTNPEIKKDKKIISQFYLLERKKNIKLLKFEEAIANLTNYLSNNNNSENQII